MMLAEATLGNETPATVKIMASEATPLFVRKLATFIVLSPPKDY
jgi:hypothetical protein